MSLKHALMCFAMVGAVFATANPSFAQTSTQMNDKMNQLEEQIRQLQQQLQTMRDQINNTQAQVQQSQEEMQKVQAESTKGPKITFSSSGRPGFASADGQNTIEFTSRLHFDVADYLSVRRPAPNQSALTDGVNARRARLGVLGKFMGDWNYALVFDVGGSTDATPGSVIENAFVTYNGFRPVAIDLGYIDVPWTLDEATSSNDIMFLERSSSQTVATTFGAGDARSALGVRSNDDRYWAGAFLTGPTAGASHTGSNTAQVAGLGRFTYQVLQQDNASVHLGVNGAYLFTPRNSSNNAHTLTLSDRPELRVDPTTILNTGAINTDSGAVLGLEGAATYENFFVQAEYFHYLVNQFAATAATPAPDLNFDGGYLEASYSIGGKRKYNKGSGAYTGVIPENPLTMSFTGWGAFELAGRYSVIDLDDHVTRGVLQSPTGGVFGGRQDTYTVGINWYPNSNVRFLLDYIHADIDKVGTNGVTPAGAHIDAIAARAQVAF